MCQLTHTAAELADWYGFKDVLRLLEEKMDVAVAPRGSSTPSTATNYSSPADALAQLAIGTSTASDTPMP